MAVLPHHDTPECPECGAHCAVPAREVAWWRPTDPAARLFCAACGHLWVGTDKEVAHADSAQAAWDAQQNAP